MIAAVDSTGLQCTAASAYFVRRRERIGLPWKKWFNFAREKQGARTIIPARHGRPTDKPASGKYRRLMQTRFNRKKYRQRSQVESTVSMIKRRQGAHVKARKHQNQRRELKLMVLTYNIMILWQYILFYRAVAFPFICNASPFIRNELIGP